MPEISDADFELLKLTQATLGNKTTRVKMLRTMKEAKPDVVLPELDTEDRISAEMNTLREENKKLREDTDNRAAAQILKEKRQLCVTRGLKPEDVEKVMQEKHIQSHESAIEFIEANNRVAAPAPAALPNFDRSVTLPVNDGLKKNPAQWAREEAAKTINEFAAKK
jgi:hypothetical protein